MKAMIFAAGLGTRFKPWTDNHPKALAPVNGKSLLQRNVEYLQQWGITDIVVNVHHFGAQVLDEIVKNKGWGSNIIISDESDAVLETGGGLLKAGKELSGDTFLTINVDILTTLNITELVRFHREQAATITLCTATRNTSRFLLFDEENRLCGWRNIKGGDTIEKIVVPAPRLVEKAYSGIAVFEPTVPGLIPFAGKFSLIDVYLHLAPGHRIVGFDHSKDHWIDVGRPESVSQAEEMFP
jgi:NDP-sugar pyrophosphorylase family protein